MKVDILYCAWNRLEFTKATFRALLANTDWSLVNLLVVYDDASTDGTAEWLRKALLDHNNVLFLPRAVQQGPLGSPVAIMNDYVHHAPADVDAFVKLDNDILVPPGWLTGLVETMERYPELEILGMQAGRCEDGFTHAKGDGFDGTYGYRPCPHIGGVGIMRLSAFRSRPLPQAEGRFGFTAWQQAFDDGEAGAPLVRGWIEPDIDCPQMDFLPFEPWASLSQRYRDAGWQRYRDVDGRREAFWPAYDAANHAWWDWFTSIEGDPV